MLIRVQTYAFFAKLHRKGWNKEDYDTKKTAFGIGNRLLAFRSFPHAPFREVGYLCRKITNIKLIRHEKKHVIALRPCRHAVGIGSILS